MPFFIPALIAGASALAGVLGNRAKKQTQTTESTTSFDNLTRPEYGEKEALVKDRILNELLAGYEADTDLSGYSALGLGNIAKGQSAKQRALSSFLASRGLGSSPMAAHGMAGLQGEQIGESVDFLNQIPLLQRNLKRESLKDLGGFFSSLPVGQRTTGTQTQKGTQTSQTPGNMLAGGLGSGMSMLGGLYGLGAFGKGGANSNFPPQNSWSAANNWGNADENVNDVLINSFKLPESGDWSYGGWGNPNAAWNKGF